jgi:hypothetical protein
LHSLPPIDESPQPFSSIPSPLHKCQTKPKLKYSWNRIPLCTNPKTNFPVEDDAIIRVENNSENKNISLEKIEGVEKKKPCIPLLNLGSIKN